MISLIGLVRPEALPLLGVVAVLALAAVWAEIRRRRALVAFAGRGADLASVSEVRRRAKLALLIAALAAAILALAGPFVDVIEREVVQSGVDLVVALDVSQSMAVRDVEPDRLRAAKAFVNRLGNELSRSRVALVLFAGEGIVRYPPTADPSILGQALDSIGGGFKPQLGGSSLSAAIAAAIEAFPEEARESARRKAVVLVGDGEDVTGEIADVQELVRANTLLFAVGVGTPSGGPIPSYDRFGRFTGMLEYPDGRQVVSRLDEDALRALAESTGGQYIRLEPGIGTVNLVVRELQRLDATELAGTAGETIPDDRYQLLLALAVAALIVEELISDRRRMPRPRSLRGPRGRGRFRIPRPAFGRASTVAVLAASTLALSSCVETAASEADRLYLAGQHQVALDRYRELIAENPEVIELRVNAGNALHQLGEMDDALAEYDFAIRAGTTPTAAAAHYQRGNTLFRQGEIEEAREAYKDALRADPGDRDAKFNIEVIDRLIAEDQEQEQDDPGQLQGGAGQSAEPGTAGPPQQGEGGQPGPGQSAPPGEAGDGEPGTEGPQASGPPETSTGESTPSLSDILSDFRSDLSPEQALRLLDALLAEQRGIEFLLEGTEQPRDGSDPRY